MSDYQQLPPGGSGPLPSYGYAYPPGQPMQGAPVPPVAPTGRSAGYLVGITAAATAIVILAHVAGFFIGRGTRLSNDEVQARITAQAQADEIARERALNEQRREASRRQGALIARVAAKAEARGRREGRAEGQQRGFTEGQQAGFSAGEAAGFSQGQTEGFSSGLDQGSCLASYLYC